MTQISVSKGPEEINLLDKVSKVLDAMFNDMPLNDQKIVGVYTIPPRRLDAIDPSLPYFYDSLIDDGQNKITEIYRWREWSHRADQLIIGLSGLGLKIIEKPKEIEDATTNTI